MQKIWESTTNLSLWEFKLQTNFFEIKEELYSDSTSKKIIDIIVENNLKEEDLEIFLFHFDEMIQNSVDAKSTIVKTRLKYDSKNKDLIFTLWDNWKWLNSINTNEKEDNYSFWWEWIWIENLKIVSNWRFKLIRNKSGAIASVKINIIEYKNHIFKNMLKKQFENWKITKDEYGKHIRINNLFRKK